MNAPRLPPSIDTRTVQGLDGTSICYHLSASPSPGAKVVVLANGLGGPHLAWRHLIDYLGDRYQFVTWDYRGLFGSARPRPDTQAGYAIERHVDDLESILEKEGFDHVAIIGWSMGVPIALEMAKRRPERVENLVLLSGSARSPFRALSPTIGISRMLLHAVEVGRFAAPVVSKIAKTAARQPEFLRWLKRAKMIGTVMRDDEFADLVQHFGAIDMEAFLRNLRALGEHDIEGFLDKIEIPTLLVTGDQDSLTPRGLAQQMARRMPNAELLVVKGGTHYTAVEFPELVNLRIERFFRDAAF